VTAPRAFLAAFMGCRRANPTGGIPSICDSGSVASRTIAIHLLEALDLYWDASEPHGFRIAPVEGQAAGAVLERETRDHLAAGLPLLAPQRAWDVRQPGLPLSAFSQYEHVAVLQRLINEDTTNTLAIAIGRDYEVRPDVTVGEQTMPPPVKPLLHASVSCKLTLRSDRAQNVRLEAAVLTRHRRGRQPHIVALTAEPLPSRLTSLARGTGDVDSMYHVALPELIAATRASGNLYQMENLDEITGQRRLLDFDDLLPNLAV
jgi:hypothetical protein